MKNVMSAFEFRNDDVCLQVAKKFVVTWFLTSKLVICWRKKRGFVATEWNWSSDRINFCHRGFAQYRQYVCSSWRFWTIWTYCLPIYKMRIWMHRYVNISTLLRVRNLGQRTRVGRFWLFVPSMLVCIVVEIVSWDFSKKIKGNGLHELEGISRFIDERCRTSSHRVKNPIV